MRTQQQKLDKAILIDYRFHLDCDVYKLETQLFSLGETSNCTKNYTTLSGMTIIHNACNTLHITQLQALRDR